MTRSHTSTPEWVAAILSALLVLGALGYMLGAALTGGGGAPVITVRADSVVAASDGYLVMFTARNTGGGTAASVTIVGTLTRTEVLEERHTVLDYVPADAERRGGLLFAIDPRTAKLDLRASGFVLP